MDVDAYHKENHAKAFTAVINPDWIRPGLHITIQPEKRSWHTKCE